MLSITVSRKMTINTGNYSSIQPSVTMTIDNVKSEDYEKRFEALTSLVDSAFVINTMEHAEMMQLIKDNGLNIVLNAINIEGMKSDIKESLEVLEI